jgi:hypothetical protein
MDEDRARVLLARRRAEREREAKRQASIAMAAHLREFFYGKQRDFFRSLAKRKTTTKTRRAGVTTGGCHELVARALTLEGYRADQGFRAVIIHNTKLEARSRAWKTDTKNGLADIVARYGTFIEGRSVDTYLLGGEEVEVRETELALNFSNGSRIELMGADSEADLGKLRGLAKHVFWIDEAQDPRFVEILESFYNGTIVPAMADFRAEVWITGTPGKDLAGFFYEITRDDGQRRTGWEVFKLSVVDNPYFGDTPEERWAETALKALIENGWTEDDPDFQREWLAVWVKTDARFVYAVHVVPDHELFYADHRVGSDGLPDITAALLDLPGMLEDPPRDYFFAFANDLGTRDDYAYVLDAWSLVDENLYEVASFKKPGLDYDDMFEIMIGVRERVHIGMVIADAGGGGKPAVLGWSKKWAARYQLPIIEAAKTNKEVAIKQWNTDIRRRRYKMRRGSPLITEMRVHRWSPKRSAKGQQVEDPNTPNHCSDAGLYAHRESYHHRFRREDLPPPPGSAEWTAREEAELEDAAERVDGEWSW